MKPLGIVLLFINLLAAAGVAFLATQSWNRRQEQNTAVVRHELLIEGFPTDRTPGDKPFDAGKAEDTVKIGNRTLRVKVVNDHFQGARREGEMYAQLPAVPLSVVGEVEAVKKAIDDHIATIPNDTAKLAYLIGSRNRTNPNRLDPGILTLLADDFEERVTYREWLAEADKPQAQEPPPVPPATLFGLAKSALDAKFAVAIDKHNTATSNTYEQGKRDARKARSEAYDAYLRAAKNDPTLAAKYKAYTDAKLAYWNAMAAKSASLSESDRRRKGAGLLAVVDPSASGQKRTVLLVGLSDYASAVLERTQRLTSMPERYERQGEAELDSFSVVYEEKLATSRDLDRLLQRQVDITKSFAAQEKQAAAQVVVRTKHRDDATGRVNDLDAKVKALSTSQQALEKEILTLQKLVGQRFDELFQLEEQVFQAEQQKSKK